MIVHLLPAAMWNRWTLPIEFVSHEFSQDESRRGDQIGGVGDGSTADSNGGAWDPDRFIPVVELRADSIHGWEGLLEGAMHGVISGCAVLLPGDGTVTSDRLPLSGPEEPPTAAELIRRFDVIASPEAQLLARHLSRRVLDLAVMREVQQDLLPGSDPVVLAEILLGGLLYRESPPIAGAPAAIAEQVTFKFHENVRDLLAGELESEELPPSPTANVPPPRLVPTASEAANGTTEGDRPAQEAKALRIGFWGSPHSGKTTFLTILDLGWWSSSDEEEWRLRPMGGATRVFMTDRIRKLEKERQLPPSSLIKQELHFKFLLRQRQRPRRSLRRRQVKAADIQVELEDMPASSFPEDQPRQEDLQYLVDADAILYFFDATYDAIGKNKLHTFEFFVAVDAWLRLRASQSNTILETYLPYHLAVCISKLDDPFVFKTARRYGCLQTDPETGRPYVPGRHARRLFEALCREQMNPQSEALLDQLQHSFHPDRISFHVLSATGFLVKDGELDLDDPSNVEKIEPDGPSVLRGELAPVNVVDPLVALIKRVNKAGRRTVLP